MAASRHSCGVRVPNPGIPAEGTTDMDVLLNDLERSGPEAFGGPMRAVVVLTRDVGDLAPAEGDVLAARRRRGPAARVAPPAPARPRGPRGAPGAEPRQPRPGRDRRPPRVLARVVVEPPRGLGAARRR